MLYYGIRKKQKDCIHRDMVLPKNCISDPIWKNIQKDLFKMYYIILNRFLKSRSCAKIMNLNEFEL